MCIICEDYVATKEEEKMLKEGSIYISNCFNLEIFPSLPRELGVKELCIRDCENLTEISCTETIEKIEVIQCYNLAKIESTHNLKELRLSYIEELTELPIFPSLRYLKLNSCINLEKIPIYPNLIELRCKECPLIQEISFLTELRVLDCHSCDGLKKISLLPKLENLKCENCLILTEIPEMENADIFKCKWLIQSFYEIETAEDYTDEELFFWNVENYHDDIRKLVVLQKIIKKRILGKKLEKLIPAISEIYYAPGCKGSYLAQKMFEKNKEKTY